MRWKQGNYSSDNVVIDDLTNGADLVCRAPDSNTTPNSYDNWERNRHIIIQAPAMLEMLKRVVQAADGGPVIQASEIEALIAAAEPASSGEVQSWTPLTGDRHQFLPAYQGGEIPGSSVMDCPQVFTFIRSVDVYINRLSNNDIHFTLQDGRTFIVINADQEYVNLFMSRVRENSGNYSITHLHNPP